ncbi:hypothetical protein KAK07_18015 [Ideonella sp. 4Y16]|uniref:hypothetical protein n=1 Tax=Ideonella alba TaxID=2824118 RepID=UPI001B395C03|nr:hypothetical protein [Ideonella alba]MBQ0945240.1 hypothetical protein [Ideonella alba]
MQRRTLVRASLLLGATAAATARAQTDHSHHDHGAPAPAAPKGQPAPAGFVSAYQACVAAANACIAHCQVLLAQGDKSLGACLRTALDTELTCGATLRAATLQSAYLGALAKTSVAAMQACIEACKPHAEHHAECKRCHDACVAAVQAANALG